MKRIHKFRSIRKLLLSLISITVISLGLFPLHIDANAAKEDYFSYTITDNKATLTRCSESVEGEITIPTHLGGYPVVAIGNYAFGRCTKVSSIIIPNGVTDIGENAFYYCTSLSNISIPDTVTQIGSTAFYECSSLYDITIPNSVQSIGSSAFNRCKRLTWITLGSGVSSIGQSAFKDCDDLRSIVIPEGVKNIGADTFRGCLSLANITLPASLTSIEKYAFLNCLNLTDVYYGGTMSQWKEIEIAGYNYDLTNAVLHTQPDPIKLKGYNLTLGNSLSINFNVTQEVMDQYEDVYMVFQVEGRDPVKVTEYFVRQNSDTDIRYNFAFDGVSILDLNVPVLATVYGTFNGVEYSYTAKNAVSVLSYCNSKIANGADDPETAGVCANLLKYAIAAEAYMNAQYGTATDGHLVKILTDAQLAAIETYATPDDQVNVEKTSSHTEGTKVKFSNQSLEMVSRITLRYKITILESGLDTSKLTFKVTYTDYNGNAACQDYTFEDLEYDAKTGEYVLSFSGFNATQMKELAKCTIYIDGVEHCYYANSIENYCCTAINSSKQPEVVKYLAKRISLYGDACYAAYGK